MQARAQRQALDKAVKIEGLFLKKKSATLHARDTCFFKIEDFNKDCF